MTARTMRFVGLLAAGALLLLTGCSQISALAPVGGDDITGLRTAAVDVLLQKKVAIKVAPTCVESSTEYRCQGTTVTGGPILVTAPTADPIIMTITVDGAQIFNGSVDDVLTAALEVKS